LSDEKKACELLSNPNNEFCQTLLNNGLCDIATNVQGLAMAGYSTSCLPEPSADKRTKVQNKYKSSSKNFQPGTADEQRTKSR